MLTITLCWRFTSAPETLVSGIQAGRFASYSVILSACRRVRPISSSPSIKRHCVKSSIWNVPRCPACGAETVRFAMSIVTSRYGIGRGFEHQICDRFLDRPDRNQIRSWSRCSGRCRRTGRNHRLESVVHQRPNRVLARRSGAEVRTGDQDACCPGTPAGSARNPGSFSRQAEKSPSPNPVRSTRFSQTAGMI